LQQLLTESLIVAVIGGALGAVLGSALTAAVPALAPADFPRLDEIQINVRVLSVAALVAVLVGVVAGTAPALRGSQVDLAAAMQADGARSVGTTGRSMRRGLVVVEAALAVVLLVGAVLLGRSFVRLIQVDAGYDAANVLTADLRMPAGAGSPERTWQLANDTLNRVRAIPGVRAAGAGDMAPFGSVLSRVGFALPGMTTAEGRPVVVTTLRAVITPGYAEALGMRLTEGRFFRAEGATAAIRPMLVNAMFAKTYFTDGPATVDGSQDCSRGGWAKKRSSRSSASWTTCSPTVSRRDRSHKSSSLRDQGRSPAMPRSS
jgi:putative ABC transport system permease protein